jgi:hypothetical protein
MTDPDMLANDKLDLFQYQALAARYGINYIGERGGIPKHRAYARYYIRFARQKVYLLHFSST